MLKHTDKGNLTMRSIGSCSLLPFLPLYPILFSNFDFWYIYMPRSFKHWMMVTQQDCHVVIWPNCRIKRSLWNETEYPWKAYFVVLAFWTFWLNILETFTILIPVVMLRWKDLQNLNILLTHKFWSLLSLRKISLALLVVVAFWVG